jgi:HEAT repeat protein
MAPRCLAAEDAAQLLLELGKAVQACRSATASPEALAAALRRVTLVWRDALAPGCELDVRVLAGCLVTPEGAPISGPGIDALAAALEGCDVTQLRVEGGLETREILGLVHGLAGDLGPIASAEQLQERLHKSGAARVHVSGEVVFGGDGVGVLPALESESPAERAALELDAQLRELERTTDVSTYNLIANRVEIAVDALLRAQRIPHVYRAVLSYWRQVIQAQALPMRLHHEACDRLRRLLRHDAVMDHVVSQATGADGRASVQASQVLLCTAPQSLPALLRRLGSDQAEIAQRTGAILIAMGERALPTLIEELEAGDPARARRAARLLGDLQHPRAVEQLAAQLQTSDVGLRTEVARSLARIGSPAAVAALVDALRGPVELARLAASCLGAVRQRSAVAALSELAVGRSGAPDDVVDEAIRSLGRIGDHGSVPALVDVLSHKPLLGARRLRSRRIAAAQALGRVGGREAYRALEAHAQRGEREVREACQRAIRALAERPGGRVAS